MGIKELGLFVIILSNHYVLAPSSPDLNKSSSPSDFMQETNFDNEDAHGHDSNISSNHSDNSRTRIAQSSKFEHGFSHGSGNGGKSTALGENGNIGGSRSPYTQGGSNFVPVYPAGSVNNRHHNNHHGAANRNMKCIGGLPILFASFLHLYMGFQ